MDDSKKSVKASSVAAFLLMPQFRFSFQQLSFIVPVFMRTVAGMFEGAGLLPMNHPARWYGMEGVKKYGFFELIGEVWHRLRATAATPFQWSLFIAVVMMVVTIVIAAVAVALSLSGMFVGTAAAQIYNHPKGDTGMSGYTPTTTKWMGFEPLNSPSAHSDYAIGILDKMLRLGAEGKGSAMQMSFGGLMEIYNSGIMVIAGVMLFWIILTIVVDTARTGQIGGGRHNLVWAPIRIVFALGLMVPLGAHGFSSGQYMVIKLAEWGSNFGTNAWNKYAESVLKNNMIAQVDTSNTSGLVNQYVKMWVCRVVYNGYTFQAMTTPDSDQIIKHVNIAVPGEDQMSFSFTNETSPNLCGTVTYPLMEDLPAFVADLPLDEVAVAKYRRKMTKAYADFFIQAPTGNTIFQDDTAKDSGNGVDPAKQLACAFVAQHIYGPASGTPQSPLILSGECGASHASDCDAQPAAPPVAGKYPSNRCQKKMVEDYYKAINDAQSEGWNDLKKFVDEGEFLAEIKGRGWAGMGTWYHKISKLNRVVAEMQQFPVSISEGTIMSDLATAASDQGKKVNEVLTQYDKWWASAAAKSDSGASVSGASEDTPYLGDKDDKLISNTGAGGGDLKGALLSGDKQAVGAAIATKIMPDYDPGKAARSADESDLYPLALLEVLGNLMVMAGLGIYLALTIVPILIGGSVGTIGSVLAAIPVIGGAGQAVTATALGIAEMLMESPIWGMFGIAAGALLTSGFMLSFWIPILPLIRVAFGVLTWMIAVFEAVVMVPIAALAHLTTEGEGVAGGAKGIWVIWLNILLRPVLMVIGYVGAMIAFNTFVAYFTSVYWSSLRESVGGVQMILGIVVYTVLYVGVIYMVANSLFKMIDLVPAAVSKYMGGHADTSFDQDASGMVSGVGGLAKGMGDAGAADKKAGKEFGEHIKDEKHKGTPKVGGTS